MTGPLSERQLDEVEEFLDVWDAAPTHRTRYRDVISSQKTGEDGRKLRASTLRALLAEIRRLTDALAEMTLCRDNAVRAAERADQPIEFDLDQELRDGLAGVAEWPDSQEPDQAPDWLISAVARIVRPELARLTEQRDHLVSGFDKLSDQMGELIQGARSERERYTAENQRLRAELDDVAGYLAAIHRHASRHDVLAANLGCAGCELLGRIEGGAAP